MDDQDLTPDETAFRIETEFDAEPSRCGAPSPSRSRWASGWGGPWSSHSNRAPRARLATGEGAGEATVLVVEEVDDERRLVFRWASTTEAPTVVELELRPIGRRTHLTIVERPVTPAGTTGIDGTSMRAGARRVPWPVRQPRQRRSPCSPTRRGARSSSS